MRSALVTGGMGGIGHAICNKFLDCGYLVIVGYNRSHDAAKEWLSQFFENDDRILGVFVNVSDYKSCQECIDTIKEKGITVDILVNNAGITRDSTFCKMTYEVWSDVIRTNLDSVFNMTKQVVNGMVERQWGRIVNISSITGQKGAFGQVNYAAAKAGVHGFTKSLALEVAKKGVTVNTVSPGYIATPMVKKIPENIMESKIIPHIPVGRLGDPTEVASLVAYLVSDDAKFITGANIAINGGQHMF
ncbi:MULTISPECIES: acetoacetyl-CoA reductase [Candidatus Ichthyocystis]|uniref:Acetoacetyl-CoA reductase n=1 Tax=Candidatus Ichthyocystis hellenicum TaxID=1561003 RepID=A0A0S4M4I2_9BURK|nr:MULTISPECIES: acetoacetyl-CoA reductase [Ichthyocystis]CUT17884.1 acetoacetyl-CoA reductase [Candidatus Ichthyocystis hellenicum]